MIKTPISLQDLRRKIYIKAKAEPQWKFWGLYVHICKMETLHEAYKLAKQNKGVPGIDGISFKDVEANGVLQFLKAIQKELMDMTYMPSQNLKTKIPKPNSKKTRLLSIPTIKDRVVQGAVKLILEPIFEADFQDGSYGYRPKRKASEAIKRVANAAVTGKTVVVDIDLQSYFDSVKHDKLLKKIASRIDDSKMMRIIKLILKSCGKQGVPQGGVLSPLLSNIYLNEVDKMLEKAKKVTAIKGKEIMEYARWADDLVVLVNGFSKNYWLRTAVTKRLKEEFNLLGLTINEEKSSTIDLFKPKSYFEFLGFRYQRRVKPNGKTWIQVTPKPTASKSLRFKLKEIFRKSKMKSVNEVVEIINPILRGWANYFRIGNSGHCFNALREWVELKVRRHMRKAKQKPGFGWKEWSSKQIYQRTGLYNDYKIRYA